MINTNTEELFRLLIKAVPHPSKKERVGLFFSGGLDSSVVGALLNLKGYKVTAITVGAENSKDIDSSKALSKLFSKHVHVKVKERTLEKIFKDVIKITGFNDPVSVTVGAVIYLAAEEAKKQRLKEVYTGAGSDEILCGYHSHSEALKLGEKAVKEETMRRLITIKKDLQRDESICKHFNLTCDSPFLNKEVIEFALAIPTEEKITEKEKKIILRHVGKLLKLPNVITQRPKKAAQYGTDMLKLAQKLTKKKGFNNLNDYFKSLSKGL